MIQLHLGECLETMRQIEANSIDAIVTDPPYGISFMAKKWDYDIPTVEIWKECLRVLKPGGHMLVACGTRTQHRMVVNVEGAGFEIRDVITWLYGSGFPKSLNINKAIDKKAPSTEAAKQWDGWGTALKPSCEFWTLARKPLSESTVAKNVVKHGTGGLNIDGCRIEMTAGDKKGEGGDITKSNSQSGGMFGIDTSHRDLNLQNKGRWPANLILDEQAAEMLDEQSGQLSQCGGPKKTTHDKGMFGIGSPGSIFKESNRGASRFFYVAKVSPSERGESKHPTMKPQKLMAYLCKLITPPGGTVLDPFMGSGSTGLGALNEGFSFIGIEREQEYFESAQKRLQMGITHIAYRESR